jgi:replicative DNA helicase
MEHGIKLAVIDYMQIVECAEGDSREQKVSTVSRLTKRAAMELDIPVIILAQINREWAKRKEHKPELFDLRESGAIEQNTDYALMVYRQLDEGVLHCNLAKNRIDGRTGEFDLLFRPDSGMYVDTYGTQTNSR